jgi:polygalacturonase
VTAYTEVASATSSCTSIILQNIVVPAKKTLDLSSLKTGTTVTFAGTTVCVFLASVFVLTTLQTFEYAAWTGDLIEVGGTNFHVTSQPGAVLDGNGAAWWDGQGSNGGGDKSVPPFLHVPLSFSVSIHQNAFILYPD